MVGLKFWKADPTTHLPDLPVLSLDVGPARGAGPRWETLYFLHLSDLRESGAPEKAPADAQTRKHTGPGRPQPYLPPACASTSDSSGSVLYLAEPRPQSSKTHVYFTRNLIHLVLIYLHLTHQMQFCKSRSIAKRLFCLSLPSERGQGRAGASALRDQQGAVRVGGQIWFLRWAGASASVLGPSVGSAMPEPGTGSDT